MKRPLRPDLADLARRVARGAEERSPATIPEGAATQAGLRVVSRAHHAADFFSSLGASRLFSVGADLAGPIEVYEGPARPHEHELRLVVPLECPTLGRIDCKVTWFGTHLPPPETELELVEGSQGIAGDNRLLEFLFVGEGQSYRYRFEWDQRLEAHEVRLVSRTSGQPHRTPSLGQMSAFLRAIIRDRRDVPRILSDLTDRSGSDSGRETLAFLKSYYEERAQGGGQYLEALAAYLAGQERPVATATLAALGFFLDMERGTLNAPAIVQSAERNVPLDISAVAAVAIAQHFGSPLTEARWRESFPFSAADFADLDAVVAGPDVLRILTGLKQMQGGRTALQVLEDLALASHSDRVQNFVAAVHPHLSQQELEPNDVQRVLQTLLESSGRPVRPSTLSALCLFVDVEVGQVTPDVATQLLEHGDAVSSSVYALIAVAGAFDVTLRGFSLEGHVGGSPSRYLGTLLGLAPQGLLVACRRPGSAGRWWRWIRKERDISLLQEQQLDFAGEVVGRFPVLDRITEVDLRAILSPKRLCLARFRSEMDGSHIWKKLARIDSLDESLSVVEGYHIYRFMHMVLASTEPHLPLQATNIHVCVDADGGVHYAVAPVAGWKPIGRLHLPQVDELPDTLHELRPEDLLGRTTTLSRELSLLHVMHAALQQALTREDDYRTLAEVPELLEWVVDTATSERAIKQLTPFLNLPALQQAVARLPQEAARLRVHEVFIEGAAEAEMLLMLSLRLLYELAGVGTALEGFRQLLVTRLFDWLHGTHPVLQVAAARLLGCSEVVGTSADLLEFELRRALDTSEAEVSRAAAVALVQVGLAPWLPPPQMVMPAEVEADRNHGPMATRLSGVLSETVCRGRPQQAQALADLALRLYETFEVEGTLDQPRYLALLPLGSVERLALAALQAWRMLALAADDASLTDWLAGQTPLDAVHQFEQWLADQGEGLRRELGTAPFLGGHQHPLTVYRLTAEDPFQHWFSSGKHLTWDVFERTAFLKALAEDSEGLHIVRVLDTFEAGDAPLTVTMPLEPHALSVFCPSDRRFVPLFHHHSPAFAAVAASPRDRRDFDRLASLYQLVPREEGHTHLGEQQQMVQTLSSRLAQSFGLPAKASRQIYSMLLTLLPAAWYRFKK